MFHKVYRFFFIHAVDTFGVLIKSAEERRKHNLQTAFLFSFPLDIMNIAPRSKLFAVFFLENKPVMINGVLNFKFFQLLFVQLKHVIINCVFCHIQQLGGLVKLFLFYFLLLVYLCHYSQSSICLIYLILNKLLSQSMNYKLKQIFVYQCA